MALSALKTIPGGLRIGRSLISTTTTHSEIQELMARRGYTAERVAEGQQLCDAAAQATDNTSIVAAERNLSTKRANQAARVARAACRDLITTAQDLFPAGAVERTALDINGTLPKERDAFLAAALTLFNNALRHDRISSALAQYGYGQMALEEGRGLIMAYEQALKEQAVAKLAVTQAMDDQRAAHAALRAWIKRYVTVARIALRGRPDLQRVLGIERKSRRKRAAAPAPAADTQAANAPAAPVLAEPAPAELPLAA